MQLKRQIARSVLKKRLLSHSFAATATNGFGLSPLTRRYPRKRIRHLNCLPASTAIAIAPRFEIQETDLLDWIRAEISASQQRQAETIALGVMKQAIPSSVCHLNLLR